jgi:hypothetical protein
VRVDGTMKRRASSPTSSQQNAKRAKTAIGDSLDDYKEGSIVRITLKNFVTYTNVTFYPGPRLNVCIHSQQLPVYAVRSSLDPMGAAKVR